MSSRIDIYGGRDPWEVPAYTIPRAARFVRLPVATLRSWVLGRSYSTASGVKHASALVHPPERRRPQYLSFLNLVEAHVLASMRRVHEIEMKKVRAAISFVEKEFDVKRPLAREVFRTNGVEIFVERFGKLICASKQGQVEIRSAIEEGLQRIEYVSGIASQLYPLVRSAEGYQQPKMIVIDPQISFGRPVVAGSGVSVDEISERFRAGDSLDKLAEEFNLARALLDEALRFGFLEAA